MTTTESYPEDLKYHEQHDWARIEGDEAVFGITWFAQDRLGELVHYEAPEEGQAVAKDGAYGEVESVKAVSDVIAPLSGEVVAVNAKVVDEPEIVNGDPYGGDSQLDQSFIWRPLPSSSSHTTAVPNLWHIGASTHPGPGLGAGSGYIVAKELTRPPAVRRLAGRLPVVGSRLG